MSGEPPSPAPEPEPEPQAPEPQAHESQARESQAHESQAHEAQAREAQVPGASPLTTTGRRLSAVPVAVLVVLAMVALLAVVALAAQIIRPSSTESEVTTVDQRSSSTALRPPPGAVDNSAFPGPAPGSGVDGSALATAGGTVNLVGRVEGDGKPLGGARVQLTRWVGERSASLVLDTNADGGFAGIGLMGGLWTITAWKEPDFRKADTQRVFMGDGQTATLSIRPPLVDAIVVTAEVGPLSDDDQLVVVVSAQDQVVDAAGEVVAVGASGTGRVVYPPGHRGPVDFAVVGGIGEFIVRCVAPAASGRLVVTIDDLDAQVEAPGCQRRGTITTTTTTAVPPSSPGTTRPGR